MPPKIKPNHGPAAAEADKTLSARVEKLEEYLQTGLEDLRNQISSVDSASDEGTFLSHLNAFESKMKASINAVKTEIEEVQKQIERNDKEIERMKREGTRNMLVIKGIPEKEKEDLRDEVCKMIKNKLKISLSAEDVDYCFRLGKKRDDKKARSAVVVFVNRWKRDQVYMDKKNLKGSGIVISEMLTVTSRKLFLKVQAAVGVKNCWTMKGNIYAIINATKKLVLTEADLMYG